MAKNTPAFQFYPSDFLGGTDFMSATAVGIYIRLMCRIWIAGGSVPYCTERLAAVCMVSEAEFKSNWLELEPKFQIEDGRLMQPRLSKEIIAIQHRSEVNSANGKKGGRPKKSESKPNRKRSKSKVKASALKYEDRRLKDEDLKTEDWEFPREDWDRPDVREALSGFEAMRKRIKKPIRSRRSTSKIFKNFDSPEHLIAVAEICEANEWQGLKPEYAIKPSSEKTRSHGQASLLNGMRALGVDDD